MRQRDNIRSLLAVRTNRRSLIRTFLSSLWFLFIMLRSLLDDKSLRGTGQRRILKGKIVSKELFALIFLCTCRSFHVFKTRTTRQKYRKSFVCVLSDIRHLDIWQRLKFTQPYLIERDFSVSWNELLMHELPFAKTRFGENKIQRIKIIYIFSACRRFNRIAYCALQFFLPVIKIFVFKA